MGRCGPPVLTQTGVPQPHARAPSSAASSDRSDIFVAKRSKNPRPRRGEISMPLLSAFASGYGATAPKRSEGGTELEWFFVVQLQRCRPAGAGTARLPPSPALRAPAVAALWRGKSARQGTPTPINSASASTRQGRCREQATQRRNRKTSNTQLRFARAGIQLRYRASRHRTSNYCPARLHFDVGRSMPARVLSELDVRCFRVFAPSRPPPGPNSSRHERRA
jgi:hypothetical protein